MCVCVLLNVYLDEFLIFHCCLVLWNGVDDLQFLGKSYCFIAYFIQTKALKYLIILNENTLFACLLQLWGQFLQCVKINFRFSGKICWYVGSVKICGQAEKTSKASDGYWLNFTKQQQKVITLREVSRICIPQQCVYRLGRVCRVRSCLYMLVSPYHSGVL